MFKSIYNKVMNYSKDDSLIRDNFVLFVAGMTLNGIGLLYHFYMGRVLGPEDYGALGTLLTVVYLLIVPLFTIQTSVTKLVSNLRVKKEYGKVRYLLFDALKNLSIFGVLLFLLVLVILPRIASFLRISFTPLLVLNITLIFVLVLPISRGVLQGLQLFRPLGVNQILEGLTKLVVGIFLVFIGLSVTGAMLGVLASYVFAFLLAFIPLRNIINTEKVKFNTRAVYTYSLPVLIVLMSLTAFYSVDVILVKHFFSEVGSGFYAALSLIGRTIFFATMSISIVMFPKVSELQLNNKKHGFLLKKSLLFVLLIGGFLIALYSLFPSFVVKVFYGNQYLGISSLIVIFAIAMLFFSLSYALAFYNLSIHRTSFLYFLIIFNLVEILLISNFHVSISQVVYLVLILMISVFLSLLIYTLRGKSKIFSWESVDR